MATCVSPIDWREEFTALKPYLNGQGGVVRIRYAGKPCAHNAFFETLKSEYERKDGDKNWLTIRIDKEIYSTRYLSGVRDVLIKKMRIQLPHAHSVSDAPASLNVASEIEGGNDVSVEVSNIALYTICNGDNPVLMDRNRNKWVEALCEQVRAFLDAGHIMLVVSHGDAKNQDEFWRYLWKDALERFINDGFLLVHMVNGSDEAAELHYLAPEPHLEINLPTALSLQAQEAAIDDLTGIIMETIPGMSMEVAYGKAESLVNTHIDDIPRLHSKTAGHLVWLVAQRAD